MTRDKNKFYIVSQILRCPSMLFDGIILHGIQTRSHCFDLSVYWNTHKSLSNSTRQEPDERMYTRFKFIILLTHWSYLLVALPHRYVLSPPSSMASSNVLSPPSSMASSNVAEKYLIHCVTLALQSTWGDTVFFITNLLENFHLTLHLGFLLVTNKSYLI